MPTPKPQSKRGDGSKQPNVVEGDGAPRSGMIRDGTPQGQRLREGRWFSW
jgi:hypothetical protein